MNNLDFKVSVVKNGKVLLSNDPDWQAYSENWLPTDTTVEECPNMILESVKSPSILKLLRHLQYVNKIRVVNNQLWLYKNCDGAWYAIPLSQEGVSIMKFIHPRTQQLVTTGQLKEVINRLKCIPALQMTLDDFNAQNNLISLKNGVLDVKTLTLKDKSSEYFFNYRLNTEYVADVDWSNCPNFKKFCQTSLERDNKKIKLLLQIIGYICSRCWGAKKAFLLVGEANCGKSVILELVKSIIGSANVSNIPLHKLHERFSLAALSDKMLNIHAELKSTPLRGLDVFKAIVSGDTLMGEHKGQPHFSFSCRTKLLFAGNQMPDIAEAEASSAFISRLCILRFPTEIAKENQDVNLLEKLKLEKNIIFSMAVRELKELIENGYQFAEPDDTRKFLNFYAEEQNHIKDFVENWCILDPKMRITTKVLYQKYCEFCEMNCYKPYAVGKFSLYLSRISGIAHLRFRENGNAPARGYSGITVKTESAWHGTAR